MPNKYEIIVKPNEGKKYIISIWDNIEEYEDYDELLKTIDKISKNDTVTLKVSSPGGRCDIGFTIYDRIRELDCSVNVIVPYPTYSMGAILSLVGDSLEIEPGGFLMFHDFSTGSQGKGNEIKKHAEAYGEVFRYKFNTVCQPFLSKKECERVLNGQDLYVKWNDENLSKRIKRHFGES